MAGLVILVGIFVAGAVNIKEPAWLSPILCIGALIIVIVFVILMFIMQTKFRPQLQDDPYYAAFLQRQEKDFKNFTPENVSITSGKESTSIEKNESWQERENRRIRLYEQNGGLFLVHTWRPSRISGQVADIAISLYQHNDGPLSQGKIASVEYHLGPKFFREPVVKTNARDNFRFDVSAYAPMLCLATVNFTDGRPSLDLERYINF